MVWVRNTIWQASTTNTRGTSAQAKGEIMSTSLAQSGGRVTTSCMAEADVTEAQASQAKANDARVIDAHTSAVSASEAQDSDAQATEAPVNDALVNEALANTAEENDAQEVDARLSEAQVTEAQASQAQATEARVIDALVIEAQTTDARASDAERNDAQVNDAQQSKAQRDNADGIEAGMNEARVTAASDWFARLLAVVSEYRQGDPTAPVTVLVSSNSEAQLLRSTLARSAHSQLRIGITVATVAQAATTEVPLADSWAVTQCVRAEQAEGYFRKLAEFVGVAETLGSAVLLWDQANPAARTSLFNTSRCQADTHRLEGISDLVKRVRQRLQDENLRLPSAIAEAGFGSSEPRLWVNALLTAPSYPEAMWLQRLEQLCGAETAATRTGGSALSGRSQEADTLQNRYCRLDPAIPVAPVLINAEAGQENDSPQSQVAYAQDALTDADAGASVDPTPMRDSSAQESQTLTDTQSGANRDLEPLHVYSAVDPFDEAGLAARLVTRALEQGTPVRDAVIATADSGLGRYRNLIGSNLSAAGVPNDADTVVNLAGTASGRAVVELLAAVREIDEPRALRFDHVAAVIRAGKLVDAEGDVVTTKRLTDVWKALRGTDPATWASQIAPCPDVAAATVVQQVAAVLATMLDAQATTGISTSQAAAALAQLLDMIPAKSAADASATAAFRNTTARWRGSSEQITAVIMQEDLQRTLATHLSAPSGGVRMVPLQAAWCSGAHIVVAVGMADDMIPGVTSSVGPLMPDEVTVLRDPGLPPWQITENHQRALAAAQLNSGEVIATFPRSDQLRTVVREPSRTLGNEPSRTSLGSITAQFQWVDQGRLGLLGQADAAAALLRQGANVTAVASTVGVDVKQAVACVDSRLHPPAAGEVDHFNGDLRELATGSAEAQQNAAAGHRAAWSNGSTDESSTWIYPDPGGNELKPTSPSGLQGLMGCPIGWWAQRVIGVSEPEPWDPRDFDHRHYGTWVHQALSLLSARDLLLSPKLSDHHIKGALYDAVGGEPSAAPPRIETADPDVLGLRFRVDTAQLLRATSDIRTIATQLRAFLKQRPPVRAHHEEITLGPQRVDLPTGSVVIRGRVDHLDELDGNRIVVTDYKTGQTGDGFQLAVYAWLWALQGQQTQSASLSEECSAKPDTLDGSTPFSAELLYATTTRGVYEQTHLAEPSAADESAPKPKATAPPPTGRPSAATSYSEAELRDFLIASMGDSVSAARAGLFPSKAAAKEHNRYCPICAGLVADTGRWGANKPSDRVLALGDAKEPEPATISATAGEESA